MGISSTSPARGIRCRACRCVACHGHKVHNGAHRWRTVGPRCSTSWINMRREWQRMSSASKSLPTDAHTHCPTRGTNLTARRTTWASTTRRRASVSAAIAWGWLRAAAQGAVPDVANAWIGPPRVGHPSSSARTVYDMPEVDWVAARRQSSNPGNVDHRATPRDGRRAVQHHLHQRVQCLASRAHWCMLQASSHALRGEAEHHQAGGRAGCTLSVASDAAGVCVACAVCFTLRWSRKGQDEPRAYDMWRCAP